MKRIFLLFVALFPFVLAFSQDKNQDLLSVPGPLTFRDTEFYLDYANHPSNTLYIQQYLPKDEKFKSFNQLLQISFFDKNIEIDDAVKQKLETIKQKSEDDKFAKSNVTQSPDGSEYIVDYTISEEPKNGDSYIEYNIFRFKNLVNGDKKPLLIFSYATRVYGDLKSAVKLLAKQRNALMAEMINFKIPPMKTGGEAQNSESKKEESKTAETKTAEPKQEAKKEEAKKEEPKTKPKPAAKKSKK